MPAHRSSTPKNPPILMGRKCFLCQNTRYRSKQCRLFRFPVRGTAMWTRWLTAMELSEEDIRPNEHPRLCQRHFDPKHFLTRQLSGMAVPVRNLTRKKHRRESSTGEQHSSNVAIVYNRETESSGDCDTECSEILDDKTSEYEVVQDVLSEEEICSSLATNGAEEEEQSDETEATTAPTLTTSRCSVPQHETLEELLSVERARVDRLLKTNAQQQQIIEEQRHLLWQLGVECVALYPDKLADDSD
uniref:THAP-type domain-containing protein n=1 Tax=Anopheles culicifacies TaxID=139723 RepID=A0A182MNQ4_9DIPT